MRSIYQGNTKMIFTFKTSQARKAVYEGKKVFSKKEYSEDAIKDLKAWNASHKGKLGYIFTD